MDSKPKQSLPGRAGPEILPPLHQAQTLKRTSYATETTIFICVALIVHAIFLITMTSSSRPHHFSSSTSLSSLPLRNDTLPDLFIFRRTRKTGSSSMVNALLSSLTPLGYVALKHGENDVDTIVRNEFIKPIWMQRKLFVVHHNQVTKLSHPSPHKVIIADSIRDGFTTITSYCRQKQRVPTCLSSDLLPCLQSNDTLRQNFYRYAGYDEEADHNYIDLPVSAAHPALSTTVLRTIFPTAKPLKVDMYNVHGSACRRDEVDADVVRVYDELYELFEAGVERLRKRMLGVAGYPFVYDSKGEGKRGIALSEMIDEAERMEKEKYGDEFVVGEVVSGKPVEVLDLLKAEKIWQRNTRGRLVQVPKRKAFQ